MYPALIHSAKHGEVFTLYESKQPILPSEWRILKFEFSGRFKDLFPMLIQYDDDNGATTFAESIERLDLFRNFTIVGANWDSSANCDAANIPTWKSRIAELDLIAPPGCEDWVGREFYPFKPEVNYSPIAMTEALFMEMGSLARVRVIGFPKMVQEGKIPVFTMVRYCFVEGKLDVNNSFCSTIGEFKERFRPVV